MQGYYFYYNNYYTLQLTRLVFFSNKQKQHMSAAVCSILSMLQLLLLPEKSSLCYSPPLIHVTNLHNTQT